ncbi:hypothetical protein MBLNU230_g2727t1 [Neophaeotheca triangularis]
MPKAEVGSTKWIANKQKSKGLQRLRWYCQICEKQCRDENGFKQHTMSEGHVRAMLTVGENPRNVINEYSNDFKRDFLKLLSTQHGEKKVNINHFYQDYIRDKEHVHMNATKWPSLTEFAKFLGREGICRVEEGERGLEIAWIDDSAGAIQRRDAVKKAEARIKGDDDAEDRALKAQMKRAREAAKANGEDEKKERGREEMLKNLPALDEPMKMSFSLAGSKKAEDKERPQAQQSGDKDKAVAIDSFATTDTTEKPAGSTKQDDNTEQAKEQISQAQPESASQPPQTETSAPAAEQPPAKRVNPLKRKNPLSGKKRVEVAPEVTEKKMSNAERIMKEELERKKLGPQRGDFGGAKKQRRF